MSRVLPYPQPVLNYPSNGSYYNNSIAQSNYPIPPNIPNHGQLLSPSRVVNNVPRKTMNTLPVNNRGGLPIPSHPQQYLGAPNFQNFISPSRPKPNQTTFNSPQNNPTNNNNNNNKVSNPQVNDQQKSQSQTVPPQQNQPSNHPPQLQQQSQQHHQLPQSTKATTPQNAPLVPVVPPQPNYSVYVPNQIDEDTLKKIVEKETQRAKIKGFSPPKIERLSSPAQTKSNHPERKSAYNAPISGINGLPPGYNFSSPNQISSQGFNPYSSPYATGSFLNNPARSAYQTNQSSSVHQQQQQQQQQQLQQQANNKTKPAINYEQLYNYEKKRANQSQQTIQQYEKLDKNQKEIIEKLQEQIAELEEKNLKLEEKNKFFQEQYIQANMEDFMNQGEYEQNPPPEADENIFAYNNQSNQNEQNEQNEQNPDQNQQYQGQDPNQQLQQDEEPNE